MDLKTIYFYSVQSGTRKGERGTEREGEREREKKVKISFLRLKKIIKSI